MKKGRITTIISIIILLIITLSLLLFKPTPNLQTTDYQPPTQKIPFLNHSLHEFEYNPETKIGYGFYQLNEFQSINSETQETKLLNTISEINAPKFGISTIDTKNKKYFFIGLENNQEYLYTLNLINGEILSKENLETPLLIIEYHNNQIYGITQTNEKIIYDLNTKEIISKEKIENLVSVIPQTSTIQDNEIIFAGNTEKGIKLFPKNSLTQVQVDDYKIGNNLFTLNAQTCTVIVGYDNKSQTGFIAHFSPDNKNIKEEIQKIKQEISIENMNITIIGGTLNNPNNTLIAYQEFSTLNIKPQTLNHLGRPYNIILENGMIKIY